MTGLHLRRAAPLAGRPALALHCMMGNGGAWQAFGPLLDGRADLSALDLPGHGRSPDWNAASDGFMATALAGAAQAMDALAGEAADGRVDLIGHSFGAIVALRLAAAAPRRIRSLSLIEPVLFAALPRPCDRDPDGLRMRLADLVAAGAIEAATAAFLAAWDGPRLSALPDAARSAMIVQMAAVIDTMPDLYDDRGRILAPGVLDTIAAPVALIRGGRSPAAVAGIAAALAARLPDARCAVVPGAGHMAPLTDPAAVARLVGAAMDRA